VTAGNKRYDVCVVGSGAGGAPIACALARRGLKVVIVERGRHYDPCSFRIDELEACIRDTFFPDMDEGAREIHYGDNPALLANHLWPGTCVGGGTVRMTGWFMRMKKRDFKPVSAYGPVEGSSLADWPIEYETLAKYYDKVQHDVGMSGESGCVPGEESGEPFGFPPLDAHPFAQLMDTACADLGYRSFATPRAVLSADKGKRKHCTLRGFCGSYGCPRGAKGSTLVTYVPEALATGNATLLCEHYVHRLEASGDQVVAAHCYNADDRRVTVKADLFVVACGSIETARLLLNSRTGSNRDGLANSSGLVGKNLTFRFPCTVDGYFPKSLLPARPLQHSTFVQRSIQDFHLLDAKELRYPKGGTISFILAHPNPINRAKLLSYDQQGKRVYGQALREKLQDYFQYLHVVSEGFIEYLPNPGTHVTLSDEHSDRWGVAVARVSMKAHPDNTLASRHIARKIAILYRHMGAERAIYSSVPFVAGGECQHGTCRAGEDPSMSVLRPDCRSHDIRNLYVTDGSFMPTGLTVPPTFTIMANSLRVADCILDGRMS
jgi:choline dehydrogenase-like flavoprotein